MKLSSKWLFWRSEIKESEMSEKLKQHCIIKLAEEHGKLAIKAMELGEMKLYSQHIKRAEMYRRQIKGV